MTADWEGIQCPKCPEPFDERSWNDRHSIKIDENDSHEIHADCCDGCDEDELDDGHHGCRDECE